ncbi:DUF4238 domain-containing protein [Photobacterium kishitanii]|uniref:DUF4238 domain-containing protein n=1 Tax=Photobacterium kishitanii TaxID=318456 RepID=UPI000431440B|nr:DUF4238 domain-containing protein [Photobacterium kishitanii]CEO40777.1 conserved hypothetical protein [Photobacterium kishitanii]
MDIISKNTPKKQHYVPQFLLKNFSINDTEQLYTYDKLKNVSYKTSVKDSACENGFYNINLNDQCLTYEHKLSKLEGVSSEIIKSIIDTESLEKLDEPEDDHIILCFFVSNLLLRVKKQRELSQQLNTSICTFIKGLGYNPNDFSNFKELNEEEIKSNHVSSLSNQIVNAANTFAGKPIRLLKAPNNIEFIISDNPVVMYAHKKNRFKSKGYSVDNVEIFLPISKKLCLSFMCPKLTEEILEKYTFIQNNKHIYTELNNYDTDSTLRLLESISSGKALQISEAEIRFINSLQIVDSYSRIYQSTDNFNHAKEIMYKNPNLKNNILVNNNLPD